MKLDESTVPPAVEVHQQGPSRGQLRPNWLDIAIVLLLVCATGLLFVTAPHEGDFWWSDAPRHAMDGVFYRDLASSLPLTHLRHWATDYYLQYPAITILFYPPGFALVEAIFFGFFGVSQAAAQLTVAAFLLTMACGAYFLSRRWLDRLGAFAVALLFIGTPGIAFWGRQVMLEIPAITFLIWSAYWFIRYLDSERARDLYLTAALLVAGVYTKQTIIFILPVYALTLCYVYGKTILQRSEVWWSAAWFTAAIVPLMIFTWLWGQTNIQQSRGGDWVEYSRHSIGGWVYVARQLPHQLGWIVLTLAVLYVAGSFLSTHWRLPGPALCFLLGWAGAGYLFFTVIALKEPRHSILLIFPFVLFAVIAVIRALPNKAGGVVALMLAAGIFVHTALTDAVPYVSGYRAAAQYLCSAAPPDSIVLFSGMRDGSFIFNVRSLPECKNITVIRSDKLLLRVAVDREKFGVKELGVSEDSFKDMLRDYGVRYVVLEPNFWSDLQSMQMLVRVLHQDQFKLLTIIKVNSNRPHTDRQLEIYQNTGGVSTNKNLLRIELPVSGITLEGKVGKTK